MVAGVLAYVMGPGKSGADARTQILKDAYARDSRKYGPKVIWNGFDSRKITSDQNPPVVAVAPVDPPSAPFWVSKPTGPVKDAHGGELQKAIDFFCKGYASTTIPNGPINIAQKVVAGVISEPHGAIDMARLFTGTQNMDDVYDISVTSVPNWTPKGGFNLGTPVASNQCSDILHNAWGKCEYLRSLVSLTPGLLTTAGNNQGRGGKITAGCLVYSVSTKY